MKTTQWPGQCTRCGSYAINEHHHGRTEGVDLDLCDVCYWRKRAEHAKNSEKLAGLRELTHMTEEFGGYRMENSGKNISVSDSNVSPNQKQATFDAYSVPRMLTPSEIKSLRQNKRKVAEYAKACLPKRKTPKSQK